MLEELGSQPLLVKVGLALLGIMALGLLVFLLRAAGKRIRKTSLILAGLLPGLLVGYLIGKGMLYIPEMPSFTSAETAPPKPSSTVVLKLDPIEPQTTPPPMAETSDEDQPSSVTLSEADILPDDSSEFAASGGITDPIIAQPDPADEDSEEATDEAADTELDAPEEPFMPRRNPLDEDEPPTTRAEQETPESSEPAILTEAEIVRQERLADAEDYLKTGALIIEDQPSGAVTFYTKALSIYKEYGTEEQIGRTYHELGFASLRAGELDNAMNFTISALKAGQVLDDKLMITRALTNLGFIYMNKRDPANALIYYNQALEEAKNAPPSLNLAMLEENIAYAYGAEGNNEKAREHLYEALKIAADIPPTDDVAALVNRINENIDDYQ